MILQRCSSEEVYDGRLEDIFVLFSVGVSYNIGSYDNTDGEDEHKVVF